MPTSTNCAGVTRRDCLRLGLGTLVGGGLAHALRLRAAAPASAKPIQAKGCILIWLDGGPTHYETFDPKPNAPAGWPAYFTLPSMPRSGGPNFLGAKYAPFAVPDDPNSAGFRVRDVALPAGLGGDRVAERTELRNRLDRMQRLNDPAAGDPAM